MNKRPGLRKRLALELFRSIRKTGPRYMNCVRSFGSVRFVAMHPASIVEVTAMFRPSILTCRSKIS